MLPSWLTVEESSIDIAAMRERDREIARLSRLYDALSRINRVIAQASTREALLSQACRVLVEHGGFRMSWVGWHLPETHEIVAIASWGDGQDYAKTIRVYGDDRPEGRGPSGVALRESRPYVCNDFFADPITMPWRDEAHRHGFRASAVFPIRVGGAVAGVLNVYATEPNFFRDREVALLTEAADYVSYALDNLAIEDARRKAQLTVQQERDFSDAVLNGLPGVLYLYDQSGRFIRWNQRFEQVTGYSSAEIAAMHPLDFFAGDDKALVASRIKEVFERGASRAEAGFVAKDGRVMRYYFTGVATQIEGKPCLVGVGIDVTERWLAEQARTASDARYRTLFEYAPDGILIADAEGYYLDANASICRMLGYSRQELVGLSGSNIVAPSDVSRIDQAVAAIKSQGGYHREWRFRRKDGSTFPAEVIATMTPDGNLLAMVRDISERKAAEVSLRELNETLEQKVAARTAELRSAAKRAEAADALKSAFLATMSHELRTPLNSILGFTGILAQGLAGPINEEQAKQLGMVRGSARHLLELINDVLDLSKIEANQLDVHREAFDLRASLARVVASVKPLADKKGLVLQAELPPELGEVISDRRRVEQIAINLLNNAIKFTPRGTVTLQAEVIGAAPTGAVRVQISDTGIGIKQEHLGALFTPFQQIDTGLTRLHEGTGLGLAICHRLAQLLGAEISVDSEWGKGSVFTLTLPFAGSPR